MLRTSDRHEAVPFQEWDKLLREFGSLPVSQDTDSDFVPEIKKLLNDYDERLEGWREEQITRADDFNILRTMGVTRKELCHSDILAWLFDPNETHAQGNVGFRLFLMQTNLPEELASKNYRVIRELAGNESQIDIVIEAEGEFVIGIENKIDSEEGDTQTEREWRDLQRRKKFLSIPGEAVAFFLAPDEIAPLCKFFQPISWQVIANIFEAFAVEAKAETVKMFAKHYAETIRREIVPEIEEAKT